MINILILFVLATQCHFLHSASLVKQHAKPLATYVTTPSQGCSHEARSVATDLQKSPMNLQRDCVVSIPAHNSEEPCPPIECIGTTRAITWHDGPLCLMWAQASVPPPAQLLRQVHDSNISHTHNLYGIHRFYCRLRTTNTSDDSSHTSASYTTKSTQGTCLQFGLVNSHLTHVKPTLRSFVDSSGTMIQELFYSLNARLNQENLSCTALTIGCSNEGKEHTDVPQQIFYYCTNQTLCSGKAKRYSKPFDLQVLHTFPDTTTILDLCVTPDESNAYILTSQGLWRIELTTPDKQEVAENVYAPTSSSVTTFTISPDMRYALVGYTNGLVMLIDLLTRTSSPVNLCEKALISAIHWITTPEDCEQHIAVCLQGNGMQYFKLSPHTQAAAPKPKAVVPYTEEPRTLMHTTPASSDTKACKQKQAESTRHRTKTVTWLNNNLCLSWTHKQPTPSSRLALPLHSSIRLLEEERPSQESYVTHSKHTKDNEDIVYNVLDSSLATVDRHSPLRTYVDGVSDITQHLFSALNHTLVPSQDNCKALRVLFQSNTNTDTLPSQRFYAGTTNGSILTGTAQCCSSPENLSVLHSFSSAHKITDLAVSTDAQHLYVLTNQGLYYLPTSKRNGTHDATLIPGTEAQSAYVLTLSPDGHYALLGCHDGTILLVELDTHQTHTLTELPGASIDSLDWSSSAQENHIAAHYNRNTLHCFKLVVSEKNCASSCAHRRQLPAELQTALDTNKVKSLALEAESQRLAWGTMHLAAALGDHVSVRNTYQENKDACLKELTVKDVQGRSPLLLAVQYGQIGWIQEMYDILTDDNLSFFNTFAQETDLDGNTVFHYLALYNQPYGVDELFDMLNDAGKTLAEKRNQQNMSALQVAAQCGHQKVVQHFKKHLPEDIFETLINCPERSLPATTQGKTCSSVPTRC